MRRILLLVVVGAMVVGGLPWAATAAGRALADPPAPEVSDRRTLADPESGEFVSPTHSPRLDSLPPSTDVAPTQTELSPRRNPLDGEPDAGRRGTWNRTDVPLDPLIEQAADRTASRTPDVDLSFEGTGNPVACSGCTPPDTNGDVGPNHYVQMVNATKIQVWDKAGNQLLAPTDMGDLWLSGSCTANAGDPIVLYDPLADRWLLAQFTGSGDTVMCFAVSETADPLGSYALYDFDVTNPGDFPDYFKLGVWPDGYYMSANEATYTAYVFDRDNMLAGTAARPFQKFSGFSNLLLPSDLDGTTAPPTGAPNHFYTFKDNAFHGGADRLEIYDFDVDWAVPGNTTFQLVATLPIASFTYTACGFFDLNCLRQPGTNQRLDQLGEWPMWRFPYRNFGSHEAMVGAFSVGGGTGAVGSAVRWFEVRKTGGGAWTLYQEGTHDVGDGLDRWLPSIAMDQSGNIAIGYSTSSSASSPSIRYATRLAGDPIGTLGQEKVLQPGGGSQTASNRWGDYAAMSVDPTDDCTFWFTSEYYAATSPSTWSTRVGTFVEPTCGTAPPVPVVSNATFAVDELAPVGTAVGTVAATGSPALTFAITAGNGGGTFAIGSASGTITLAKQLDYETVAQHILTVTVSDGGLTDAGTITVNVADEFEVPAAATFGDVATTDLFFADIEWLAWRGITKGCNPPINDEFCPDNFVTRGQMAAFLVRALGLTDTGTTDFVDDDGSIFETDIEKLAAAGITRGCNPPINDEFCPDNSVTRGQMAAFLVRALGLTDTGTTDFVDDDGSIFETDIEKLAAAGITRGCNPPINDQFCPDNSVTRGQMAAFLRRALG